MSVIVIALICGTVIGSVAGGSLATLLLHYQLLAPSTFAQRRARMRTIRNMQKAFVALLLVSAVAFIIARFA